MRFYTREWKEGKLDENARGELDKAAVEHANRLRPSLPPALTFLTDGGGVFGLHDAEMLALVVDDAGQVVLRLHQSDYYRGVELTISYAHARLMGITDDEREELNAEGASIYGDELDASADGGSFIGSKSRRRGSGTRAVSE